MTLACFIVHTANDATFEIEKSGRLSYLRLAFILTLFCFFFYFYFYFNFLFVFDLSHFPHEIEET